LEAVPETSLYYPGSIVVSKDGQPQVAQAVDAPGIDGSVDTRLRSPVPFTTIAAWYKGQLLQRGWVARGETGGQPYRGYTLPPADVYTRGLREEYFVGFDPVQNEYYESYVARITGCNTVSPYPFSENGSCDNGKPLPQP
jgi:hypothetical protein